jgi:hypothetical protein
VASEDTNAAPLVSLTPGRGARFLVIRSQPCYGFLVTRRARPSAGGAEFVAEGGVFIAGINVGFVVEFGAGEACAGVRV